MGFPVKQQVRARTGKSLSSRNKPDVLENGCVCVCLWPFILAQEGRRRDGGSAWFVLKVSDKVLSEMHRRSRITHEKACVPRR